MSQNQGRGTYAEQPADDSYWAALFQMEEVWQEAPAAPDEPIEKFVEPPAAPPPASANGTSSLMTATRPVAATDPWQLAHEYMDDDRTLQLKVIGHNKGGLLVAWNGIQGFVPASQLIDFPQFHVTRERLHSLAEWQDRVLQLKIIEVNQSNSRLIFSERATLVAAEQRETLLGDVRVGQQRDGKVTNLTDFGAFVDLGGLEGLIHISEISWSRVVHPSHVLRPGQSVNVLVLNVDQDSERVALSMKRLRPDPWYNVEARYRPGQLVSGVIGNVTTYGAFVILEEELEGLIHISELAEGTFMHPNDVVRTGQSVTARVLSVDGRQKRLALSLRSASRDAGDEGPPRL